MKQFIKRKWLLRLAGLALIAVVGLWLIAWWLAPENRMSWETFEQIEVGMSEDEVIAILGVPPGTHTTRRNVNFHLEPGEKGWHGDYELIIVEFADGKVVRKKHSTLAERPLATFRRWTKLW
jgi:outer membrane protein assembly factor BamE (lipoprotein component of BamABCDE complex)